MKIVLPEAHLIDEPNPLRKIELCGRLCYKSEEKISNDSDKKFVQGLIMREHTAMLEHATFLMQVPMETIFWIRKFGHGTFLNTTIEDNGDRCLVSGNLRAWRNLFYITASERQDAGIVQQLLNCFITEVPSADILLSINKSEPSDIGNCYYHMLDPYTFLRMSNLSLEEKQAHTYMTMRFICDRGVTHELVRMRVCSFAQESTRYCNYEKAEHLVFVKPSWVTDRALGEHEILWDIPEDDLGFPPKLLHTPTILSNRADMVWFMSCAESERDYLRERNYDWQPQQSRDSLVHSVKSEIIVTCDCIEWNHIFDLRLRGITGAPHPQMLEVMELAYSQIPKTYKDKGIIE